MKLRALPALAGVALLALGLAACSGSADAAGTPAADDSSSASGFAVDENTLVFGVVPDSVDTETNYQPLMDYIAEITGKTVEYHESTDYAALIEAAVAGKVDVASFSGFTYVTATNNGAKLTPISSIVTEEGQEPGYFSQAIVPAGSDIKSLEDFKGKKVCFVDPSSTSGYLFPSYNLLKAGIDPKTDITPVFAGKHDVSVTKVGEGVECEAGFAEDSEVEKSDKVKVIDETMVPGAPLVYSSTLPDDVSKKLIDGLSEITIDDIIAAGIDGADTDAFRSVFYATKPVDDAYYDLIRDICKETEAEQCQA
ncbi:MULTISPECIES: phosphate/phosphite/phosphonate ABC transporter substrate-binding protein [unclassified Microbacterium]|jgi:phosphonate transport system substrate-binding protein|uniref:phosphate/phosphite/phosphonate ABC transporter substrate-binding protein n=1 Tax=unclassified Microbacterium TaxID=2609290 RepID=UPI000CFD780C|nr:MULTISPECIES: phosphate/phosphite/phosphonate ABC transporter substrate-binding protein [unclassified Microbacterium]PQZ59212.1 phosphate/phosphite/phosphonate ABC transporter substrate-binding protein [Microbacterium sp. MYb43]PQZ81304.1 phosphate/phosphite/phosphonate ABC transporter substrate-binding protein [Microbacterium sp. MYb40]PRB21692.1 phosphate/phosphite/phosphonate ABC transporter substrate-binding protein [Microbacterium sp. MYb54]PRB31451.1 phosphate/phosphite/phosphonate ABC